MIVLGTRILRKSRSMTRKSHSSEPSRIRWKHFSEQTSKTLSEMHKLHLLKHLPDWLEVFRSFRKFSEQGVGQRLKQMYELRKFTKDPVTAAKQVLTLIQKKRNVWYGTVGISLPRKQESKPDSLNVKDGKLPEEPPMRKQKLDHKSEGMWVEDYVLRWWQESWSRIDFNHL